MKLSKKIIKKSKEDPTLLSTFIKLFNSIKPIPPSRLTHLSTPALPSPNKNIISPKRKISTETKFSTQLKILKNLSKTDKNPTSTVFINKHLKSPDLKKIKKIFKEKAKTNAEYTKEWLNKKTEKDNLVEDARIAFQNITREDPQTQQLLDNLFDGFFGEINTHYFQFKEIMKDYLVNYN
mmetsp:Transcript_21085/g.23475  ORF Transcript_21085/g.23475 Transcript_21085/m.23475 type:complete len:180 (-) Transcript_21085:23-562(-)